MLARLGALTDTRRGHGLRHRQRFVLACAAVSTIMGACGYRAFENTCKKLTPRQLRALGGQPAEADGRYYPPSDTFQRVLKQIDAAAVATMIGGWLAEQEIGAVARLAVDGKVLRGSGRHDGKARQLLSAVTQHLRLTLDQLPIEEKSNEIPALKPLLNKVKPPPGTLITADAIHCQQAGARFITQELGGDYLFGLKGNQSGILDKAERLLAQQGFPPSGSVGEGPRPVGASAHRPGGRPSCANRPVRLLANHRRPILWGRRTGTGTPPRRDGSHTPRENPGAGMDGETTTARQLSGRVTQARQREGYATPSPNPDESALGLTNRDII